MSISVTKYAVKDHETIQDIAQYQLGARTRWLDIVSLNNLRAPYISDVLTDHLGPIIGTLTLQQSLSAGETRISNWDTYLESLSITLLIPGSIIVFVTTTVQGDILYDAAVIDSTTMSVAAGSAHVLLNMNLLAISEYRSLSRTLSTTRTTGMQRDHSAGERFYVYSNPFMLSTAVAKVGDLINLPVNAVLEPGNVVALTLSDIVDALGVDIALTSHGQKTVAADGDVQTVSGIANLKQAIKFRINTVPGELGMHPGYGCMIQFYLGTAQSAAWADLVQSLIHDCLLQDPRINTVDSITYVQKGDAGFVNVQVTVSESSHVLSDIFPLSIP